MNLSFYKAEEKYCDFLREKDPRVPYVMNKKENRPFIGIVVQVRNINYYAPLSSPKPKHLKMKNQLDFMKINGGFWGAINFNNMIPIHRNSLSKIDMKILSSDSKAERDYKNLLTNQLSWCNSHKEKIVHQATNLYQKMINKEAAEALLRRCCNFSLDEQQYHIYCKQNDL